MLFIGGCRVGGEILRLGYMRIEAAKGKQLLSMYLCPRFAQDCDDVSSALSG